MRPDVTILASGDYIGVLIGIGTIATLIGCGSRGDGVISDGKSYRYAVNHHTEVNHHTDTYYIRYRVYSVPYSGSGDV